MGPCALHVRSSPFGRTTPTDHYTLSAAFSIQGQPLEGTDFL